MYVMLPTSRHWRAGVSGRLTAAQTFWLFRPGALTSGLCGLGQVVLRVSREYTQAVCASEACLLKLPARAPVWVREVVMAIDGIDCVSARSLTPLRASHGAWAGIRRLNTRPLAAMLYSDSTILRSPFAWRQLMVGDPVYRAVCAQRGTHARAAHARMPRAPLFARRSVFWRQNQPLIVAECFLPAFWEAVR